MEATTQTNTTIVNYIIILMFMVKGMLRRFVLDTLFFITSSSFLNESSRRIIKRIELSLESFSYQLIVSQD